MSYQTTNKSGRQFKAFSKDSAFHVTTTVDGIEVEITQYTFRGVTSMQLARAAAINKANHLAIATHA